MAGLGGRIVFTNGCFDVLHAGHVAMLREARAQGDSLIVAINSDASIRALKGPDRPINPLSARFSVLLELRCVDQVLWFHSEAALLQLIRTIRPAVLVKGADSLEAGPIPGADLLAEWGGRLHLARYVPGVSTTEISGVPKQCARAQKETAASSFGDCAFG